MKKVWILERYIAPKEMQEHLANYRAEYASIQDDDKLKDTYWKFLTSYEETVAKNPGGYWLGFEGKSNYKSFCQVAIAELRRVPKGTFRVVEGEIEDDAKYWPGYKIVKVNGGVLRYLWSQVK